MSLKIPVSAGELLDKITILQLKVEKILDPLNQAKAKNELQQLLDVCTDSAITPNGEFFAELQGINRQLWEVEDNIRAYEQRQDFGPGFIALARSVYHLNDRRFELKRSLNKVWQSAIEEVKSYKKYRPD